MRYVCTMCCVVYTCQYILALSIEQPRNAENALLSFGYLSAGPSRQKAEFCLEDERKNIVKLECELLVQQPWKSIKIHHDMVSPVENSAIEAVAPHPCGARAFKG